MTQYIKLNEVKIACRKAYARKRLLAQDPEGPGYAYRLVSGDGVERCCAIGAALDPATLDAIDRLTLGSATLKNPNSMHREHSLRDVIDWDRKEAVELMEIQKLHDSWLGDIKDLACWYRSEDSERKFVQAIS